MNGSDTYSFLEKLGLTEYEAKTLSTLFSLKEAEAPHISRTAQVPKTRVYDVLEKLIQRNLIIEIKGRPKLYRAVEAQKAIDILLT
ncbi:MAG: helix-turn-helix domain-containing protein, partial [archaeon]